MADAYPLDWPIGEPRAFYRRPDRFKVHFTRARDELIRELKLLGARDVVISSNIPLRRDGIPYADAPKRLTDPGVAVYWTIDRGKTTTPFVMACDRYDDVTGNLRAIGLSVAALRALERHGTKLGFADGEAVDTELTEAKRAADAEVAQR